MATDRIYIGEIYQVLLTPLNELVETVPDSYTRFGIDLKPLIVQNANNNPRTDKENVHRDLTLTQVFGDDLYGTIPSLLEEAARIVGSPIAIVHYSGKTETTSDAKHRMTKSAISQENFKSLHDAICKIDEEHVS